MIACVAAALAIVLLTGIALAAFTSRTARRIDALLPPPGKFVDIHGAQIHYVEKGSGPPILMIHGLGAQLRHFTYAMMDQLASDYRVIAIDRPGSGNSTRPPGMSASALSQTATVTKFIETLGLERPLVVGHSLGGLISLVLAVGHPELVRGLVLISPFSNMQHEVPLVFRALVIKSAAVRGFVSRTIATPIGIITREKVLGTIFGPEQMPADFPIAGGGLLGLRPTQFLSASEDLVAMTADEAEMPAFVERYRTLNLPVGILYGTEDRVLDHRLHGIKTAAMIPNAELELIEGAGHMLPLTASEQAVAMVRRIDALT